MNSNNPDSGMVAAARGPFLDQSDPARRRFQQVCVALARCERQFAEIEDELTRLGLRTARLRSERESLRELLDRKGAR